MYKIIIVEDEEKIRSGLKNLIDWHDMGFEVVGDFEDGKPALGFIEEHEVDVVLTDIKMNEVSGIELAREIREKHLDSYIVFISGFKDFEYARNAISYNIEYYLLKPVKLYELYKVFSSIRSKLDAGLLMKENLLTLKKQVDTALPYLEEQFLYNLLTGAIRTNEQLDSRKELLGKELFQEVILIVVIDIAAYHEWVYGKENLWTAIINSVKGEAFSYVTLHHVIFDSDKLVFFCVGRLMDQHKIQVEADRCFENARKNMQDLLKVKVNIGKSSIFYDPLHSVSAYIEARRSIAGLGLNMNDQPSSDGSPSPKDHYKSLMEYIFQGDQQAVESLLEQAIDSMFQLQTEDIKIRNALNTMVTTILHELRDKMPNNAIIEDFDCSLLYLSDHIIQVRKIVVDYFLRLSYYFCSNKVKTDKSLLSRAKEYILHNYQEDISLNSVAETVYLSPSYFSRIFKEYTGKNFIDFIIDVRIQKAKELLAKKDAKVYEVAESIGYNSQKYFSRLFKQYVGMSPSDYQNIEGK